MSPFLELDIGSSFNRNGTSLVQIMGIDREQALGDERKKLNRLDEARWVSWGSAQLSWTECSSLGQLGRVQTVIGPCGRPMCTDGPVGSCGWTMGVDNHFGLVLDMSRGGLEGQDVNLKWEETAKGRLWAVEKRGNCPFWAY
ncbi:hypothetical protein DY000_02015196 [Brassica cretica]|uniref:Uncharacterized protein n=1 Tax=Brassica cretica TaxID=69181 RepID=A0ABQ7CPE3_BRACR|nr:hypothetical protein DY000_02015196 [Brassica cretica]